MRNLRKTLLSNTEALRSKAWVCGRSLNAILGSNPYSNVEGFLLLSVVIYQVAAFASG